MIENKSKALLFKTANLGFFKALTNVELGHIAYNDDFLLGPIMKSKKKAKKDEKQEPSEIEKNHCILAYQNSLNKKNVVVMEFIFNEDGTKVLGVKNLNIEIEFNSTGLKYVGLLSNYLIVSSSIGNKVHMYDATTGNFEFCLFLGNFPYEISGLHLDNKHKIISIVTNNKYLKLYKLNKLSKKCNCLSHPDEKVSMNEERGVFDKFKHKLGVGRNDFLCRYKVNTKVFDMKDNKTLVFFDKNSTDFVYVIQLNKNVKKLKFDRKKTRDMIVMEEITLPEYFINKNDMRAMSIYIENEKKKKQDEPEKEEKEGDEKHMYDDDDADEEEAQKKEGNKGD